MENDNRHKRRIIDLAVENKLSHIGSALSAVDIIAEIYKMRKPDEPFVLSQGHANLALQVVLESEGLPVSLETHPEASQEGVWCSTGSLGHGLPIAVGMALADRTRRVWCLISDGECAEGSIWEALRIASEQNLTNLIIFCNANGYSAYGTVDIDLLEHRLLSFFPVNVVRTSNAPLEGIEAHYQILEKNIL